MSMNDHKNRMSDHEELARQVERGALFTHTILTDQILRINENEAFLYGLIDCLTGKGMIQPDELKHAATSVRREMVEKNEHATLGVAIRVDDDAETQPAVLVNCEERLHICRAVCCRLRFALTAEEIETGRMKWELGNPYYNRHYGHGYCHQIDPDRKCCTIYDQRPSVCRKYSCAGDTRIWKDFERMEFNREWVDDSLNKESFGLIEVFMDP